MKRNNKKGFTIVELVIVIAVIAILSAVLIPTFGNVRENAQKEANKANARNTYTQYMSNTDNLDKTVDYVEINDVYYSVANGFEVVTLETGKTTPHGYVLAEGNVTLEGCETNCPTHKN